MPKYGVISGPYFPAFGLNMESYEVSLGIQSECGEIRTRNYSEFGHFSPSAVVEISFDKVVGHYSMSLVTQEVLPWLAPSG